MQTGIRSDKDRLSPSIKFCFKAKKHVTRFYQKHTAYTEKQEERKKAKY